MQRCSAQSTAPALRAIPATQPWHREYKWMWQVLSTWGGDVWQIVLLRGAGRVRPALPNWWELFWRLQDELH